MFIWAGGLRENIFFRDPKGCALSPTEAEPFDEVWFVDVCPWELSQPAGGKPWRVFDHHDTNIRRHGYHDNCVFDVTCCGASLLARETETHAGRQLIDAIESYDLGRFNDFVGMQIADLASAFTQEQMLEFMIEQGNEMIYDYELCAMADGIGRARKIYADKTASGAHGEDVDGVWYAIAAAPAYWKNDVADHMLDGRLIGGEVPAIAVVVDYSSASVSLRSRADGPNVAMIAEQYGGGGHPRAAGFRLSRDALAELFQGVFG